MSFSVEMPVDQFTVDAGSTAPVTFSIKNASAEEDQFEIQIEGLDPEWTAIPVPVATVEAGGAHSDKLFLKPPRVSESQAGNYPFVLRVRSMTTGEAKVLQGVLGIKPFHYLSIELSPKRGVYSPMKKENFFEATVLNMGNSEHTLQLFGNDPEDALTYTFSQEQVVIGPGQTRQVEVEVVPAQAKPFASMRLHGFSVGARSIDAPSVACSAQGQLEQRAFLSPGSLAFLSVLVLLFLGWLALLPKPPEMELLRLSAENAYLGDRVTIRWQASNAKRVRILLGTEVIEDTPELTGSRDIVASRSGVFEAVALSDGRESSVLTTRLTVTERPLVPAPEIEAFTITPKTANKGDTLTVNYRVNAAVTKLTLSPPGQLLDPKIDTIFITASVVGAIDYALVAENHEGKTVRKSIRVTVVDPTLPRIDEFRATPTSIEGDSGMATLSWRTANAVRLEILRGSERIEIAEPAGSRDFIVDKTTEFELVVYDAENRKQSKKIKVEVKPIIPVDPGSATTGGGR